MVYLNIKNERKSGFKKFLGPKLAQNLTVEVFGPKIRGFFVNPTQICAKKLQIIELEIFGQNSIKNRWSQQKLTSYLSSYKCCNSLDQARSKNFGLDFGY